MSQLHQSRSGATSEVARASGIGLGIGLAGPVRIVIEPINAWHESSGVLGCFSRHYQVHLKGGIDGHKQSGDHCIDLFPLQDLDKVFNVAIIYRDDLNSAIKKY